MITSPVSFRDTAAMISVALAFASPAFAQTCFPMGSAGSLILPEGGDIFLAFNDNNGTYGDNDGAFDVVIRLERSGQVIEGPINVTVCSDAGPCLSDFCAGTGATTGIIALGWNVQVGDEIVWSASGMISRFNGEGITGPDGDPGNVANENFLCSHFGNAWGLVGAVNGWPSGNHTPPGAPTAPCPNGPCPSVSTQIVAGQSCSGVPPMPVAVPTVSEWGLVLMALLTLTAGTIMYSRRRVKEIPA